MARPGAARDARTPEGKTAIQAADRSSCTSRGEPAIPRHRKHLRCATDSDNARTRRSRSACDDDESLPESHLGASQLIPSSAGPDGSSAAVTLLRRCWILMSLHRHSTSPSRRRRPRAQHRGSTSQPANRASTPPPWPSRRMMYIVQDIVWCRSFVRLGIRQVPAG